MIIITTAFFNVFSRQVFQRIVLFLEIKILYFPVELPILFQSPPPRTPLSSGCYSISNSQPHSGVKEVIPNFYSFFTFLFIICHTTNATLCCVLDHGAKIDLGTEWTVHILIMCPSPYSRDPTSSLRALHS